MPKDDYWTPPDPIEPAKGHKLAQELGEFILAFSKLEGMLAYYNSMLLFRDSRHSDEASIVAAHMGYAQKVSLFQMLCNHIGIDTVTPVVGDAEYRVTDVVDALRKVGSTRNRLVHDEVMASTSHEAATVFRLQRRGDPFGEGWLQHVGPEEFRAARVLVDNAYELASKFMLAADRTIVPRS